MTHNLKTLPGFFNQIACGNKRFEIRKNDRKFKVGDWLNLREFDPVSGRYTGRFHLAVVSYITEFEQKPGFVVMSIK